MLTTVVACRLNDPEAVALRELAHRRGTTLSDELRRATSALLASELRRGRAGSESGS